MQRLHLTTLGSPAKLFAIQTNVGCCLRRNRSSTKSLRPKNGCHGYRTSRTSGSWVLCRAVQVTSEKLPGSQLVPVQPDDRRRGYPSIASPRERRNLPPWRAPRFRDPGRTARRATFSGWMGQDARRVTPDTACEVGSACPAFGFKVYIINFVFLSLAGVRRAVRGGRPRTGEADTRCHLAVRTSRDLRIVPAACSGRCASGRVDEVILNQPRDREQAAHYSALHRLNNRHTGSLRHSRSTAELHPHEDRLENQKSAL